MDFSQGGLGLPGLVTYTILCGSKRSQASPNSRGEDRELPFQRRDVRELAGILNLPTDYLFIHSGFIESLQYTNAELDDRENYDNINVYRVFIICQALI